MNPPLGAPPGYSSSVYPMRLRYRTRKSCSILSLMGIGQQKDVYFNYFDEMLDGFRRLK